MYEEDVIIRLFLLHNALKQVQSIAAEISEAISDMNQEFIIHESIEKIDKWLCESIHPIFLCTQKVIRYIPEIVKNHTDVQIEFERKILNLTEAFSLNPMLEPDQNVYLNLTTLKELWESIKQYELSFGCSS